MSYLCFNGATSFQTWKCCARIAGVIIIRRLQWGHVFSDVEIKDRQGRSETEAGASMGPRLFRRGNIPLCRSGRFSTIGFNGATSFQTWKSCVEMEFPGGGLASMGPRLFRRGNPAENCARMDENFASMGPRLFRRGNMTQLWGQGNVDAASMGPRLFRRGNVASPLCTVRSQAASMGPRLFRRGNYGRGPKAPGCAGLQWGHVFSDVEIPLYPHDLCGHGPLQWGHVFSDVEMSFQAACKCSYTGFNGATSFQTWKSLSHLNNHSDKIKLQWGHVFSDVEMLTLATG